jgi:hypothetical protein
VKVLLIIISIQKCQSAKNKIGCELGRLCYFLEGDMWIELPYSRRAPIFGMDVTDTLIYAMITPIPYIGARFDEIDSYRLEENGMTFTIHTLHLNYLLAYQISA